MKKVKVRLKCTLGKHKAGETIALKKNLAEYYEKMDWMEILGDIEEFPIETESVEKSEAEPKKEKGKKKQSRKA